MKALAVVLLIVIVTAIALFLLDRQIPRVLLALWEILR